MYEKKITSRITQLSSKIETMSITRSNEITADSVPVLERPVKVAEHSVPDIKKPLQNLKKPDTVVLPEPIPEPAPVPKPEPTPASQPIITPKPKPAQYPKPVQYEATINQEVLNYSASARKYSIRLDVRKGNEWKTFSYSFVNDTPYDIRIGSENQAIISNGISVKFPYRRKIESGQEVRFTVTAENMGNQRKFEIRIPVSSKVNSNNIFIDVYVNLIE